MAIQRFGDVAVDPGKVRLVSRRNVAYDDMRRDESTMLVDESGPVIITISADGADALLKHFEKSAQTPGIDIRCYPSGDAKAEQAARDQAVKDVLSGKTIVLVPEIQPTRLERLTAACGLLKEHDDALTDMHDGKLPNPFVAVSAISEAKRVLQDLNNLRYALMNRISASEATLFGVDDKMSATSPQWVTGDDDVPGLGSGKGGMSE